VTRMDTTVMRREIGEIPATVDRILDEAAAIRSVASTIARFGPRWVTIAARGTSDHAAVYAQYLIESHLGIPTGLAKPSITTLYQATLDWHGGLLLAISQSGRSPDIVAVTEAARTGGALTVAIVNEQGSPLAAAADEVLLCHAGRELAVPATKTYVADLAVLAGLVGALQPGSALLEGLESIPATLRTAEVATDRWLDGIGSQLDAFAAADRALVVSRGYNLATALELALKLKETSGLFAEPYSSADFAHGPLILAGPGVPALGIRPDGVMGGLVDGALETIEDRGGRAVVIGGAQAAESRPDALALPIDMPESLTPLVFAVAGQLLVEAIARRRGLDPDAPPGLNKVTLTR
jgi:glutamine---fructose-6-phosphate transaminase (isomerizing)